MGKDALPGGSAPLHGNRIQKIRAEYKIISASRAGGIMPVFRLQRQPFFPSPDLAEADGLLAVGGDLSPIRLLAAYRMGIFP